MAGSSHRNVLGEGARVAVPLAIVLLIAAVAAGQFRGGYGGYGRRAQVAGPDSFDGSFQFCRLVFRQASNGDGGGWGVDWPRADENLSIRLSELTKTPVG